MLISFVFAKFQIHSTTDFQTCQINHNPIIRTIPIDVTSEFTFKKPDMRKLNQNPVTRYKLRNDPQVSQLCEKPDFVKLYNDMPHIELLPMEKKLTITIDLDETLFNRPKDESTGIKTVFWNPIYELETQYTKLRPFAHEFLTYLSEYADLYAWTMSTKSRAKKLMEIHQTGKYFKSKLITREDVTESAKLPDIHVKSLDKLYDADRNEKNVLHLDDRCSPFILNQLNGLRIGRYGSDDNDIQLIGYMEVFRWIFKCFEKTNDVQPCVALLKTTNKGLFDGFQADEYSFEPKQHLSGYERYTDEARAANLARLREQEQGLQEK
eukprot:NODE_677_length_4824_cov_0.791323.p2 type:complete len:323 gc:universal NODE_677_length_4824_cov_0.791323:294-1262(+)